MKTRFLALILAIIALIPMAVLTSCGSSASYANDVPVSDICTKVDALLTNPKEFALMSADYIKGMMYVDTSKFADYAVKLRASGANVDEYGIFKAPDNSDPELIRETVEAYLKMRVDTWMPEYMPEEFPKMQSASVKVFGQYVVYCILDEATKANVFSAVESALVQK